MNLSIGQKGTPLVDEPARKPLLSTDDNPVLNVALYPWVPRPQQFKDVISQAWNALGTGITINYVDYDCYNDDPPATLDVFAFDTLCVQYLVANNFLVALQPSQITGLNELQPFTLQASQVNGTYYGIPYLGCGFHIIYTPGDAVFTQANTLPELADAIGNHVDAPGPEPQGDAQVLIDLSGGTTDATFYTMAEQALYERYTLSPPLPSAANLDSQVVAELNLLVEMGGRLEASFVNPPGDTTDYRLQWLLEGEGRALVAFSEQLAFFPADKLSSYAITYLPLMVQQNPPQLSPQLYFTDALGINSQINPAMAPYALQLINLIASEVTMLDCLYPDQENANPQYLIPAHFGAFAALAAQYPLYNALYNIMTTQVVPTAYQLGPNSRSWLAANKAGIRDAILNFPDEQIAQEAKIGLALADTAVPYSQKSTFTNIFRRA